MKNTHIIPFECFPLRFDFPYRCGFVGYVNEQLKLLRCSGTFIPPRFFGYYFRNNEPVGVTVGWTVVLDQNLSMKTLLHYLQARYGNENSIECMGDDDPECILIHDRYLSGFCWLMPFREGEEFVARHEPTYPAPSKKSTQKE